MKALIVVILLAMAAYLGYRILSKPKSGGAPVVEMQPAPASIPGESAPAGTKVLTTNRATAATVTNRPAASKPPPQPSVEWKPKLEEILGANLNTETKLRQLRDLLSSLPETESEQAVQELTRRVNNQSFGFIKPLVVDQTLPEPVRDEFMADLMNRPNSIKIPLFLEIARNPDHPDSENTFDTLEVFTGLKYGADWNGWEKGIEQWLKENPDEPPLQPPPPAQVN